MISDIGERGRGGTWVWVMLERALRSGWLWVGGAVRLGGGDKGRWRFNGTGFAMGLQGQ